MFRTLNLEFDFEFFFLTKGFLKNGLHTSEHEDDQCTLLHPSGRAGAC